jgi:hypothetical protein
MARHIPDPLAHLSASEMYGRHLAAAFEAGMIGSEAEEFADIAVSAEVETIIDRMDRERDAMLEKGDRR